jgi:hypothetical protein
MGLQRFGLVVGQSGPGHISIHEVQPHRGGLLAGKNKRGIWAERESKAGRGVQIFYKKVSTFLKISIRIKV